MAGSWSQNPEAEIELQHSDIGYRDPTWCLKRSDLRTLNNIPSSCPFLPLSPSTFPGSTLLAGRKNIQHSPAENRAHDGGWEKGEEGAGAVLLPFPCQQEDRGMALGGHVKIWEFTCGQAE